MGPDPEKELSWDTQTSPDLTRPCLTSFRFLVEEPTSNMESTKEVPLTMRVDGLVSHLIVKRDPASWGRPARTAVSGCYEIMLL